MRPIRTLALLLLTICVVSVTAQSQPATVPKNTTVATAVAVVNGAAIPYSRYDELCADQRSYQLRLGMTNVINQATEDQLLMQLIDQELIRQEAARRKITVTHDAARALMLKNPPDFMRVPFTDDKGTFHRETLEQVVNHPELMAQMVKQGLNRDTVVKQWRNDVEKVITFVQNQELMRRLKESLEKEEPLTPAKIRARYFAERTRFDGSFVRVLHSTIPDSLTPVQEEEARRWYNAHIEDYRFASARQIATLIMPVVPGAADSARQRATIAAAREKVENAPMADRSRIVSEISRDLMPNRFPVGKALNLMAFPAEAREALRHAKPGNLVGPFNVKNEDILLFIEDTATTGDTVLRARHVLVPINKQDTSLAPETHDLLDTLRTKITTEEFFLQAVKFYSQDASKSDGGDLGYFGRGTMVPEFEQAAFAAPLATCVGPIRTKYGYHLIWVTDRITTGYKVRELRFPFTASAEAVQRAHDDAVAYAAALQKGTATDSMFFALRARYPRTLTDTSILRRLDVYGDALAAANFGFNAEVGDVGVLSLPFDRIMVAKLLYAYPTGVAPYDKIRANFVYPHVRRAKQLEVLEPRMKELRDTMTADMMLGVIRLKAPWAESFMIQDQYLTSPPDEDTTLLDPYVETTPDGGVAGPVRGKHGYYFLRIIQRHTHPTAADFTRDRAEFTREYTERYRQRLLDAFMKKARDYAVVDDRRAGARPTEGGRGGGSGGSSGF